MCGISGIVVRESESVDEKLLARMAASMAKRGPDAQGTSVIGKIGLAHRRLSVIDLSVAANQPLYDAEGEIAVVFNGEIYNFAALRSELEGKGHRFRTRSDTEVIVRAFREWGTASFARFNGMFAFGLVDGRGREPQLFLVRDRFGIKPLFYAEAGGRLAFASELKPLLHVPWIDRTVSPATVFQFLKFSHVPSPLSIIDGVRQLEPGHWMRFAGGQASRGTYWDVLEVSRHDGAREASRSEGEWIDELERVLSASVERQLVSDVPLGCFLSGGIDSSLLTATHASLEGKHGGARIHTFSIGYAEEEFDETPFAAEVARALGTSHHQIIAGPSDFFDLIPDVPAYFDQPFADPTLLPSLLLSRFARGTVTVALSGDGGDELFFGYPHQRALLALGALARVPHPAREAAFETAGALAHGLLGGAAGRFGHQLRKLSEILQFENEGEMYQYLVGTIGPLRIDRLARLVAAPVDTGEGPFFSVVESLRGLPARDKITQVFLRTFLVDTVLAKTDRAGMAFGLEARVPFLDDEMVDLSRRLPYRYKVRFGSSKHLLRKLLARKLAAVGIPADISLRPKQGFSVPIREWLRGDLKYLLDEYLFPERLQREGIFDAQAVRQLVREHVGNRANHSHLLWSLVSFQMWKERYLA